MKLYRKLCENEAGSIPRVLGLTATVVKKNVSAGRLADEIERIEKGLCSKAVTYEAYQDVLE